MKPRRLPAGARLRLYRPEDAEALARVFRDSVNRIGPRAYGPEQVRAWAQHPEDMDGFRDTLAKGITLLAEMDGEPVAFGQLFPQNHIAYLYCAGAHNGRGLASSLYDELEHSARGVGVVRLFVEASRLSRPLFEHKGFKVTHLETVQRHGTLIERFRMEKLLVDDDDGPEAAVPR